MRLHQQEFTRKLKTATVQSHRKDHGDLKLDSKELTDYRCILGAMLWLCNTRPDLLIDVGELQTDVNCATIAHLKVANALVTKTLRNSHKLLGLIYAPLHPPFRIVTNADSSHATKESAYAREGVMVLLMEDRGFSDRSIQLSPDGILLPSEYIKMMGFAHCLVCASHKAKRVSYSTSHAETLSACFGKELAQVLSLRLTEVFGAGMLHFLGMVDRVHTVNELIKMQELNLYSIPTDHCTDCDDLFKLVCSGKALPQDRMQRVYVMSIREDRVHRRIRFMIKLPTEIMVADGLTKQMDCKVLRYFMEHGWWLIPQKLKSDIVIKGSPALESTADERKLANLQD